MKIVRFRDPGDGSAVFGVMDGDVARRANGNFTAGFEAGEVAGPLEKLELLAPIEPRKIVCVGLNYAAHVTERDPTRKIPEEPVLFMKPPSSVIGPGEAIEIAYSAHETHHEAELVVVIGERADRIGPDEALSYVFGYTCGNDVSDRVLQKKDGQWIRAKGFRTYCPLGPWIETDLDLTNTPVVSRVNGNVRQSQTTASMLWDVPTLIAYVSGIMTLDPGDILMTGTPEGVGPLRPGDVCDIEIEGVGTLRNPVVASRTTAFSPPPARQ